MHSQYAESQSSNDYEEQHTQQHTIFQKYSQISSNNQHSQNRPHQPHESHDNSEDFPDMQEITPIPQTKVVDSNIQVISQDDQQEKSLIESVAKEDSGNDLQFISQSDQDLANVPEASSKIIHQAASRHEINQYIQGYQHQAYMNSSIAMHPHRVMNHSSNYQQQVQRNYQHENHLRHTISSNVSPRQMTEQMNSGQQLIMRGSLPPNMSAQQLVMKQGSMQQNYGHLQQMTQQGLNQRQFAMMPSSPQLSQQQLVPHPGMGIVQGIHSHGQQVRVPHHVPQSLVPVKNVKSQTLVENVNFIKNGPQRLQTSEIVYKARNPVLNNKTQSQIQLQQPNHTINAHYLQQQNVQRGSAQMISRGSGSQGHSLDGIRSNTRSLQKRQTNVVFNYNVHQQSQQQQRVNNQVNPQMTQQPPQQIRSASLSPIPINIGQPPVIQKTQIKSPQIAVQRVSRNIEIRNEWKERYFGLYERLETVNRKVEYINEEFHIYEKIVQISKEEKILKRHTKIMNVIQELQQECISIVHEWRPTSEYKSKSKQKVQTQNVHKDKHSGHLEIKYKRLLFNYSKLQEQKEQFKKTFEQKIHQVVIKLESENSSLTETIKKLQSQNKALRTQVSTLKQNLAQSQQQLHVPVQQSDDLTLSQSLKLQLEESIARYYQQNRFLQDELERVNQCLESERSRNQELVQGMRMMEQQLHLQKVNQRETTEAVYPQKRIEMESIEKIIEELNQKIVQYQLRLSTIQDQLQRVNVQYRQLEDELKNKQQQLMNAATDVETLQTNNLMLTEEVQNLNHKILVLQNQLINDKRQFYNAHNTNYTHTQTIPNNQQETDRLQVQNSKLHQQNVSLRDQLQRLNHQVNKLNTELSSVNFQLQTANQRSSILQQQLDDGQMNLADYNIKISNFQQQIKDYQQQLTYLQQIISQNNTANISHKPTQSINTSPILIQQYQFTIATLRSEVNRKQSQIQREARLSDQRILDLTEQLKLAYKERESLHKKYEEKTLLLEGEREKKQILIRELRDKLYSLQQKLHSLQQKHKIQQTQQTRNNEYITKLSSINETKQITKVTQQLESLKTQKDKITQEHQLQKQKLTQDLQQLSQDNFRLKKQISQFTHTINELQQMSEALSKKNMEILNLKNIAFENQKLIIDNNNFRKEIDRQVQQNARLQSENDKMQKTHIQLSRTVKELENNLQSSNSKLSVIQNDYNHSQQLIHNKDMQINKLRLSSQSLEQQLALSHKQQQKLNQKLRNLQIAHEQQSMALKNQQQAQRAKQLQFDQLMREKSISDHKVAELDSYKQKYEYQLKENQQLITKIKSKLKILDSEKEDLLQEVQSYKQKFAQIDKKSNEQTKKYKKIVEELQEKNKHLQQKQLKFEKQKIHQLQTELKTKQNKIWKLQKQLEELIQRLDQVGDQQITGQKVIFLQQKVKDYEARLFTQAFKYTPTNYDYQATKVFEQKVIYQLKQQNQRLKQFISQKKTVKPTNDKDNGTHLGLSRAQIQIKQAYDQELDEVQGRLTAFNNKLESLINNGTYDQSNTNENLKKTRKSPSKLSNINMTSQNQVLGHEGSSELKQLRGKYAQLERYCKNIEVELLSGNSQKIITSNNIVVSNNSITHNEVTFLKEKNKELDERVEKLLKMNTQLKENMEHLLQQRNDHSSLAYYKEQISELTQKITLLEQRLKKTLDENEKLKGQIGTYSKSEESGQLKTFELQRKITEMQRTMNELQHSNFSLQNEVKSGEQQLQAKIYEIRELRNQLSQSGQKESSAIITLRQQLQNTETELMKSSNKLRIQQSEIERLNQMIKKRQSEAAQEVGRWRTKVNQLQEQLSRVSEEKQAERGGQSTLKIQISRLSQEIKSLNFYNQEIKQTNENIIKKLQQSESRLRQVHAQHEELQNALSTHRLEEQQWAIRLEEQEAQSAKLTNQTLLLRQEIKRLNEQSKLKQRNHEIQLHSLQEKLTLNQRELLNSRKTTSLIDTDKQFLENQLQRLKSHIAQLNQQLQDLTLSLRNKQLMYEEKINTLKTQITQIESHSNTSQHTISDLQQHNERAESQINQLKNQITILKSEIQRLTILVRDKDSNMAALQNNINAFKQQQSMNEHEIAKLVNQTHLLKQQIDRLNFTMVEKDSTLLSLRSKNEAILLEKDNFDRQLVQALIQIKSLRQQKERLLIQIKEIQSSSSSQVSGLSSELYKLRKETEEFKIMIKTLQVERDNDQRQITNWISQFNLLKQQNLSLLNKIAQLETTYLSAIKISPAEFEALRGQNQELRQSLRVMGEKFSLISRDVTSLVFFVQLNRSIILEIEALLDQKLVSSTEEVVEINYRISEEIGRGLNVVLQMRQKLDQLI